MTVATDAGEALQTPENSGKAPTVIKLLVAATFVVILNETIMINAMPRLMVDFEVTARTAQWLSSVFMLTMAAVIPITGWFLQRVTTRTAYTVAMSVSAPPWLGWPPPSRSSWSAVGFRQPERR